MNLPLPMDSLPPGKALGAQSIPGSKSVALRALLLAAQCQGPSRLRGGLEAEDTRWMRKALRELGVPVVESAAGWEIHGGARPHPRNPLWLGASGGTLRFLLPWLALHIQAPVSLRGEARLFERPVTPLLRALEGLGARWESHPGGGILHPVPVPPDHLDVSIAAALSSQFVTGLALAAAGLPGGGRIRWVGAAASRSYLELSVHWMERFGCPSALGDSSWEIPGGRLRPHDLELPGDWSGAAAFLCAAAVTGRCLDLEHLDAQDPQGDRRILEILAEAGCSFAWEGRTLAFEGNLQRGLRADLAECPDLAPVLAATAALAPGESLLTGLGTLPFKECDRLEASAELVHWLGGRAEILEGPALRIHPGLAPLSRQPFDPRGDHRMAFAAAVGGLRRGGELKDPQCVAKTFPAFWGAWRSMLEGR